MQRGRRAALGSMAGAVARVLERTTGLGLKAVLVTALLASVGIVAVTALRGSGRPRHHRTHNHGQRPRDQQAPSDDPS